MTNARITGVCRLGPWLACVGAVALLAGAPAAMATPVLATSRQVLDFTLDSVRHVESGPPAALPATPYVQTQTLHFAPFDPTLGTLRDAYLSYEDLYGFEYVVKAGVRAPHTWEDTVCQSVAALAHYTYALKLAAPGVAAPVQQVLHGERVATYVLGTACSSRFHGETAGMYYFDLDGSGPKGPRTHAFDLDGRYLNQPWVSGGSLDVPLLDLADGLDLSGDTVDVTLEKNITQLLMPIFSSSIDPAYSSLDNHLNQWTGRVALTYVYDAAGPSPVPAPGTLGLLAVALMGAMAAGAGPSRRIAVALRRSLVLCARFAPVAPPACPHAPPRPRLTAPGWPTCACRPGCPTPGGR